jgi:hypothetical protein
MSALPVDFKVVQKEWDTFWRWIYTHTSIHHVGPEVRLVYLDPSIQRTREQSMLFFLTHKDTVLNNTPKCKCGSRYIHIEDHIHDCPVKLYNTTLAVI